MEDKLDTLSRQINDMSENISLLTRTVNSVETNFDKKIEELKESLNRKIEDTLEAKKLEIKTELKDELSRDIDSLRQELSAAKTDLEDTKSELGRLRTQVEPPYDPSKSVVIYGLKSAPEEATSDTVRWLFSTVLQAEANIVNVERIAPRGTGQIGVVRVELLCVEEKINILRAKRRCVSTKETKDVVIRTCDGHESRVNKLNNRKLLSLMPGGKEYLVADNGLIKKKTNVQRVQNGGGDEASDTGAHVDNGNNEVTPESMGDNMRTRETSEGDGDGDARTWGGRGRGHPGAPRGGRPTNQQAERRATNPTEQSVHSNNNRGGARGGARGGGFTAGRGAGRGDGNVRGGGRGGGRGAPGSAYARGDGPPSSGGQRRSDRLQSSQGR